MSSRLLRDVLVDAGWVISDDFFATSAVAARPAPADPKGGRRMTEQTVAQALASAAEDPYWRRAGFDSSDRHVIRQHLMELARDSAPAQRVADDDLRPA